MYFNLLMFHVLYIIIIINFDDFFFSIDKLILWFRLINTTETRFTAYDFFFSMLQTAYSLCLRAYFVLRVIMSDRGQIILNGSRSSRRGPTQCFFIFDLAIMPEKGIWTAAVELGRLPNTQCRYFRKLYQHFHWEYHLISDSFHFGINTAVTECFITIVFTLEENDHCEHAVCNYIFGLISSMFV